MSNPQLIEAFRNLATAAQEVAEICDQDIREFAGVWHGVVNNIRVLENAESLDLEDVKSLLSSIKWLFSHHPGSFLEAYIPRSDFNEQVRENKRFDNVKDRVYYAAADVKDILKIDPYSY